MTGSDAAFAYQFMVGFLIFFFGLYMGFRHRTWSFRRGEMGEFVLLVVVFLGYLTIQGFFQFLGPVI
ncbi:MAG: hypothetical protein ISR64_05760 [Deltaproteobacteria bacterium]|nr:hypothetical protein [Deltaproteobacteria bacterium]